LSNAFQPGQFNRRSDSCLALAASWNHLLFWSFAGFFASCLQISSSVSWWIKKTMIVVAQGARMTSCWVWWRRWWWRWQSLRLVKTRQCAF
jgi:hypothetical protein